MDFVRRRTLARQITLQYLYMHDLTSGNDIEEPIVFLQEKYSETEIINFALRLINEAIGRNEEIDTWIAFTADNWKISRMPVVDRNVIRMAITEMLIEDIDTPIQVIINEAIEIARKFSTEESGIFVNGILDKVATSIKEGVVPVRPVVEEPVAASSEETPDASSDDSLETAQGPPAEVILFGKTTGDDTL